MKENRNNRLFRPGSNSSLFITAMIAILLSFLVAAVVMIATGIQPKGFFDALLRTMTGLDFSKAGTAQFFRPRYVGEFIQVSLPLILCGLSIGFAYRTGMFNIGAEGQLIAGILCSNLVALTLPLKTPLLAVLCIIAAGIGGGLWAFVPGFLKARFGVHEVVTTIMFNYVAMYISNWILKALPGSNPQRTVDLPQNSLLGSDFLRKISGNSRLHWGFIVVILSVLLYNFIMNRTSFGYELRAVGFNRHAAAYAGMNAESRIILSMVISGIFAGLGGAMVAQGTFTYGRVLQGFENYGFDGISVALLGGTRGVGILLGGLLLGGLRSGQPLMQAMGVPLEIAQIVSGLIILFVAMQHGIERLLLFFGKRRSKEKEDEEPVPAESSPDDSLSQGSEKATAFLEDAAAKDAAGEDAEEGAETSASRQA